MTDLGQTLDGLPEELRIPLRGILAPGEALLEVVTGVGATLVLTADRLIMVRDGAAFRPRSGVRTWDLVDRPGIRSGTLLHGTGRLLIEGQGRPASLFITESNWPQARVLIEGLHRRVHLLSKP
jgi:hypothetical protein